MRVSVTIGLLLAPGLSVFAVGATPAAEHVPDEAGQLYSSDDTFLAIDRTVFGEVRDMAVGMCEAVKHPANPVVRNRENAPDSCRVGFPFSVTLERVRFRAWYLASDGKVLSNGYAESHDGVHWERPALGLVDYRGSTRNNIVRCTGGGLGGLLRKVWRDDEETDAARRYKAPVAAALPADCAPPGISTHYGGKSHPSIRTFAYSRDGLRWQDDETLDFPVRAKLEASSLYRMHGRLFMASQMILGEYEQVLPWTRFIGVSSSDDGTRWTLAPAPGFHVDRRFGRAIQTHVGPACQSYGNVIVAALGLFRDNKTVAKQEADITLVLTNDGMRWRQPTPDQPLTCLLRRGDKGSWDHSFLVQGSLINVGSETFLYYCARAYGGNTPAEPGGGGIQTGLATLPLDRFGYMTPARTGRSAEADVFHGHVLSKPILLEDRGLVLYLNVSGAARPEEAVDVELRSALGQPIPDYTFDDCDNVTEDGVGVPVTWRGSTSLDRLAETQVTVAIRMTGRGGGRAIVPWAVPRLYAFYFDRPCLRLNAEQRILPGRGVERHDCRDPFLPAVRGIRLRSDRPLAVTMTRVSEADVELAFSDTAEVTLRWDEAEHVAVGDRAMEPTDGAFTFAASPREHVLIRRAR